MDNDLGIVPANETSPQSPVDSDLGIIPAQPSPQEPDTSAMRDYVEKNLATHKEQNPDIHEAQSFFEALKAGLQGSSGGLLWRQKMPDTVLPEHASRAFRIASQIGQFAGDLPAMAAGGSFGGVFGAGLGAGEGSVIPGAGTAVGGITGAGIGAMSGSFAVPQALRKILIDHYEKGDIQTPGEFVDRLMGASWEAIKGGLTGAATAVTGGAIAPVAGPIIGLGSEMAAMTTVGAALEGHLPHSQDFIDGAIVIGGLHGFYAIAPKLRNIYAATGETPDQVVAAIQKDPQLKQDLLSDDARSPIQAQPTELQHFSQKEGTIPTPEEQAKNLKPEIPPVEKQWSLAPKQPEPITRPYGELENEKLSDNTKDILSSIGEPKEPEPKSFDQKLDDWRQNNIDQYDPLAKIEEIAKERGAEVAPGEGSYALSKKYSSVKEKVDYFLENGVLHPDTGEKMSEGLYPILRDMHDNGLNMDEMRAYGIAKTSLERFENSDEKVTPYKGFDPEKAQEAINELGTKYQPYLDRINKFKDAGLEYAKIKGAISQESVDRIKEANKQHFPLNKLQDPDIFTGKVSSGGILKKFFGADKELLDPLTQVFRNFERIISKSDIYEVRDTFRKMLRDSNLIDEGQEDQHPESAFLRKVPMELRKDTISSEELSRELAKQGIELEPDDINFFRYEQGFLKDNQIIIPENDKQIVYEGTPGVINALKSLEGNMTVATNFTKVMRGFAKLERFGITTNPAFSYFAHPFRTQVTGGLYSKTGLIPFYHPALAMSEFFEGKSQDYSDFINNGGAVAYAYKLRDNYLADDRVYNANKKAPFMDKAWNAVTTVEGAKALVHSIVTGGEEFIKNTDNLTRFTEFKRAREQGKSVAEAATLARNVVVDYQQRGLVTSAITQATPFLSTHINSLDRMYQEIKNDPKAYTMKLAMLSTISGMLWAVNQDDPAIQSLPDWQKNTYWNINLSRITNIRPQGKLPDGTDKSYILKLPKPWAPGILAGSGAEVALDAYKNYNPKRISNFVSSMFESVIPKPVPALFQPMLEQYANKSSFTGRPLVSEDAEKRIPELQYEPYTSETAKQIAKIISYVPLVKDLGPSKDPLASPEVVENYIKGWSGTLGQWALRIADAGLHEAGLGNKQAHSTDTIADEPFLSSFISRYPSFKDQNVLEFYENKTKTDQVINSIKWLSKTDPEAAMKLQQLHPDLEVNLDGISKNIGTIKKFIQAIENNSDMKPVEKRQLIDTALFQIGSQAKYGNQLMDQVHKVFKK